MPLGIILSGVTETSYFSSSTETDHRLFREVVKGTGSLLLKGGVYKIEIINTKITVRYSQHRNQAALAK